MAPDPKPTPSTTVPSTPQATPKPAPAVATQATPQPVPTSAASTPPIAKPAPKTTPKPARKPARATRPVAQPTPKPIVAAEPKPEAPTEKLAADQRELGAAYLASYEKVVVSIADSYERAVGATNIGWLSDLASMQAELTREVTKAYTSAVRELVS